MPGFSPGTLYDGSTATFDDSPALTLKLGVKQDPDRTTIDGRAVKHFEPASKAADKFADYIKNAKKLIEATAKSMGRPSTSFTLNMVWNFETYVVDSKTAAPIGYLSWGFAVSFSLNGAGNVQYKIIDMSGADKPGDEFVNKGGWQWHNRVDKDVWETYPKK